MQKLTSITYGFCLGACRTLLMSRPPAFVPIGGSFAKGKHPSPSSACRNLWSTTCPCMSRILYIEAYCEKNSEMRSCTSTKPRFFGIFGQLYCNFWCACMHEIFVFFVAGNGVTYRTHFLCCSVCVHAVA
jgi:hypothetical protein